jgi:hypothetical protein
VIVAVTVLDPGLHVDPHIVRESGAGMPPPVP